MLMFRFSTLLLLAAVGAAPADPCATRVLGFYNASCDAAGNLLPPPHFGSIQGSLDAAVAFYARAPLELPLSHGLPSYAWATFTSGYIPTSFDIITMQDSMGIFGYLRYLERSRAGRGGNASAALTSALALGEYLVAFTNTPAQGVWANVTRSTGLNYEWPLFTASQGDITFGINCIETDRVAMAGYALLLLHEATGGADARFLEQALRNARVLAATQAPGNATHAPWPFRVDAVSGAFLNGHKNGESAFPLRLLLKLSRAPYSLAEFVQPAAALWAWVRDVQLPTARFDVSPEECLFVNCACVGAAPQCGRALLAPAARHSQRPNHHHQPPPRPHPRAHTRFPFPRQSLRTVRPRLTITGTRGRRWSWRACCWMSAAAGWTQSGTRTWARC
jgi:hypothetical protein